MRDAGTKLDELLGIQGVDERVEQAEARLEALLRGDESSAAPPSLRVASAGGKRLRPALAVACAAMGDPRWDAVLDACVAVELVQVGSLVHDDIFEKADTRRGTPTINAVEGEGTALMAGDYILARAAEAAARSGSNVAAAVARTIEQLCLGQIAEMVDLFNPDRTIDSHLDSIARKTAALFACSCEVGGLSAEMSDEQLGAVSRFGHGYGMAYQLLDDVLDLVSDSQRLGKPANIDIASGVYTLPVILALQGTNGDRLRELLDSRAHDEAREVVLQSGTVEDALAECRRHSREAETALEGFDRAESLREFPCRYVDWALERFT